MGWMSIASVSVLVITMCVFGSAYHGYNLSLSMHFKIYMYFAVRHIMLHYACILMLGPPFIVV